MAKRMATAGVFLALACAGPALAHAQAGEPDLAPRALRDYRSTTQHGLSACGSTLSARPGSAAQAMREYRACVSRVRTEVAVRLDAAVRSLDSVACVAALRRYNVAFEEALAGIEPQPAETVLAYEQRQVFLFHAMAHAWGRFEIAESFAY